MTPRIVCPDCGMSTWKEGFGCTLPGCENYAVLVEEKDADSNDALSKAAQSGP